MRISDGVQRVLFRSARQGSAVAISGATPTLGGSQMGARLAYAFSPLSDQRITLAGRVYQPLARRSGRTDAAQAVIGLELQPLPSLPIRLAVDRYVAIAGKARASSDETRAGHRCVRKVCTRGVLS